MASLENSNNLLRRLLSILHKFLHEIKEEGLFPYPSKVNITLIPKFEEKKKKKRNYRPIPFINLHITQGCPLSSCLLNIVLEVLDIAVR